MGIRYLLSPVSGAAVASELQSYGLDVILDDPLHNGSVRLSAAQTFIDRYRVVEGTLIVRTEPGALLGRFVVDPTATDVLMNSIMATGWVFVPGEVVTAESAIGRMADRLRAGQAVTVTRGTAPLLGRALTLCDPVELSALQRRMLNALAWFAKATDRPVLVTIRPPRALRTPVGWRSTNHLFASFPRKRVRWWPRG